MGRFTFPRARASIATVTAAVLLACTGVIGLVFQPTGASAENLKPEPAEFTVKPGDAVSKSFSQILIGSAEVRPTGPDDCRNNPAIGLTCAAHRIKIVNRTPGYFLRITTTWLAQGQQVGTSVPDVDTYLYDGPGSSFNYNEVGGVSGSMPEQIKLANPPQDEFDLVIGAYAGALVEHEVLVEYVNASPGLTPAAADMVLSPKGQPFHKAVTSVLLGETGSPATYPLLTWAPSDCRDPLRDVLCDVYRIKLNRNKAKDALNFVVVELNWDARQLPDISTPAAGLGLGQLPDLDMVVWDTDTHDLERGQAGGQGDGFPERVGFVAVQDEYDLVVQVGKGVVANYTITAFLTDAIFDKPFEFLDPVTGQPLKQEPDGTIAPVPQPSSAVDIPPLALAPIDVDDQIAGIGLGTTEQFDREEAIRLGEQALRNVSIDSDPPSATVLILALGVVPLGILGAAVAIMRRRHNVMF